MASTIICYDFYGNEVKSLTQWDVNRTLRLLNWEYTLPPIIQFTNNLSHQTYSMKSILSLVFNTTPDEDIGVENTDEYAVDYYIKDDDVYKLYHYDDSQSTGSKYVCTGTDTYTADDVANLDKTILFEVPNDILRKNETVTLFIGIQRKLDELNEIETIRRITFPVQKRVQPEDYIYWNNAITSDTSIITNSQDIPSDEDALIGVDYYVYNSSNNFYEHYRYEMIGETKTKIVLNKDSYTKSETYSKSELDTKFSAKANASDVYDKTTSDSKYASKDAPYIINANSGLEVDNGALKIATDKVLGTMLDRNALQDKYFIKRLKLDGTPIEVSSLNQGIYSCYGSTAQLQHTIDGSIGSRYCPLWYSWILIVGTSNRITIIGGNYIYQFNYTWDNWEYDPDGSNGQQGRVISKGDLQNASNYLRIAGGNLADGAVTTAKIDGGAVTTAKLDTGAVTYAKLASEVQALFASVFRFKGKVSTKDDLPVTGNTVGDVWGIIADKSERVYVETSGQGDWINLGLDIDLSSYLTSADAALTYQTKTGRTALDLSDGTSSEPIDLMELANEYAGLMCDVVAGGYVCASDSPSVKRYIPEGTMLVIKSDTSFVQYIDESGAWELNIPTGTTAEWNKSYHISKYEADSVYLSKYEANQQFATYQKKNIYKKNISISTSNWQLQQTPTYADFPYIATVNITGVTANDLAEVIYDEPYASSGKFASVCDAGSGCVYVYAKEAVSAEIKRIKVEVAT